MELNKWFKNVTPAELEKIAEHAQTKMSYLQQIKRGWGRPSNFLRVRLILAATFITPDRIPDFDTYSKSPKL